MADIRVFPLDENRTETALALLRSKGCSIVESILLLSLLQGISPGEAKMIVHASDAWSDGRDARERFHDALEDELKKIMGDETE